MLPRLPAPGRAGWTVAETTDFSQGHTDPTTMPRALFEYPPATWGYVAAGYLAGVEVGRRQQPEPTPTPREDQP
jgi:hypothetical protein